MVPLGQVNSLAGTTYGQVTADITGFRDARQRMFQWAAVNQQYAFISLFDCRQVLLRHDKTLRVPGQGFHDDVPVGVLLVNQENRGAAHAVQGLEYNLPVLFQESMYLLPVTADQGGSYTLWKLSDEGFFINATQCGRVVDDKRAARCCVVPGYRSCRCIPY